MFAPTLRCECAQPGLIDTIWEWSIMVNVSHDLYLYFDHLLLGWCQVSIDKPKSFGKTCSKKQTIKQQQQQQNGYHWPLSLWWNETHVPSIRSPLFRCATSHIIYINLSINNLFHWYDIVFNLLYSLLRRWGKKHPVFLSQSESIGQDIFVCFLVGHQPLSLHLSHCLYRCMYVHMYGCRFLINIKR